MYIKKLKWNIWNDVWYIYIFTGETKINGSENGKKIINYNFYINEMFNPVLYIIMMKKE